MTYGEQHKHTAPYPVPAGREGEQACAGADPDVFFPDSGFAADGHETVGALPVVSVRGPVPGVRAGPGRPARDLGRHDAGRTRGTATSEKAGRVMGDHRLRDLWLSECWKPVPEWHPTRDEREDAEARNSLLNPSPDVSTGCARNGAQAADIGERNVPERARGVAGVRYSEGAKSEAPEGAGNTPEPLTRPSIYAKGGLR